jgi:hypothetical protein
MNARATIIRIRTTQRPPYVQKRSTKALQVVANLLISLLELRSHFFAQLPEPTQSTPQPPADTRAYRQSTGYDHESPDTGAVANLGHIHAENRRSRVDRDENEREDGDCRILVVSRWHRRWGLKVKLTCDGVLALAD